MSSNAPQTSTPKFVKVSTTMEGGVIVYVALDDQGRAWRTFENSKEHAGWELVAPHPDSAEGRALTAAPKP
jgi:N-acetylneuraminic acid mutarotase